MIKLSVHPNAWLADDHPENLHRAMDEIALTGYDGIELTAPVTDHMVARGYPLKELLDRHGLELSALYCTLPYSDPVGIGRDVEGMKARIARASDAGSSFIILDGAWPSSASAPGADCGRVADAANDIAALCHQASIRCCWHQHYGTIFDDPPVFERFMELTDPELVGFCPDTGQLLMSGFDVTATLRRYLDRIWYVHLKDLVDSGPRLAGRDLPGEMRPGLKHVDSRWRPVELGRGLIDFNEVGAILRGANYQGWWTQDLDFTPYNRLESASYMNRFMRDLTARHFGAEAVTVRSERTRS
jgi:inosose dehydratase